MDSARITHNEIEYEATYEIFGDTLRVLLPDGSTRETELRGLHAEQVAITHLRSFANTKSTRP